MDVLYHYCSTESFLKIVLSRELWLSSLSLSNDRMEGKLVAAALQRLAEKDDLPNRDIAELKRNVRVLEDLVEGLGFCLSQERDLLSQWRGYSADGTGVSIGFSTKSLLFRCDELGQSDNDVRFDLRTVEYDFEQHEALVKSAYDKIKQHIAAGVFRPPAATLLSMGSPEFEQKYSSFKSLQKQLDEDVRYLVQFLFRLKAPAFSEEREVRLFSYLLKIGNQKCEHRMVPDRIIPFRRFKLDLTTNPIFEVVLGPKHITPPDVVANFLRQNDYGNVKVSPSIASYR